MKNSCNRLLAISSVIVALFCLRIAHAEDPRVTRLVEAHVSAVALIHRFDAEIESSSQLLVGPEEARKQEPGSSSRWSFDTTRQRYRDWSPGMSPPFDGPVPGYSDSFADGRSTQTIFNWARSSTKSINLLDQGDASAEIAEIAAPGPVAHVSTRFMFRFCLPGHPAVGLHTLLSSVPAENVEYLGAASDGSGDEGIRVRLPAVAEQHSAANIDIFFRPSLNYFAVKMVTRQEGVMMPHDKTGVVEPHFMEYVTTGAEFRECGGGVWVPTVVHDVLSKTGHDGPVFRTECRLKNLTVNKPLPADALDFQFPENLFVRRTSADGKFVRTELYGADGKVQREINTTDELNKILAAEAARQGRPVTPTRSWYLTLWVVGVGLLIAAVGYRQWQRRNQ